MVAIARPTRRTTHPATGAGPRLRLVVDNGPARGGSYGERGPVIDGPAIRRELAALPRSIVVGLVAAAVVIFGGVGLIRVGQDTASVGPSSAVSDAGGLRAESADHAIVVVAPGDSLWSIALEVAPDEDPRWVVDQLVEANGGVSLQIGQQIVIPGQLLD